jgi:hypothetical protein
MILVILTSGVREKHRRCLTRVLQTGSKTIKLALGTRDSGEDTFMNGCDATFIGSVIAVSGSETEFRIEKQGLAAFPLRECLQGVAINGG